MADSLAMGRRVARENNRILRRTFQLFGLLGGGAWVTRLVVAGDESDLLVRVLWWSGAVLVTVALLELGLLLVKRGAIALRLFVAWVVPVFAWMVVGFAATSVSDAAVAYAAAGAVVACLSVLQLAHRGPRRATL